jgi:hypothetical protein
MQGKQNPKSSATSQHIGTVRPGTVWKGAEDKVTSTSIAMERKIEPALLFVS